MPKCLSVNQKFILLSAGITRIGVLIDYTAVAQYVSKEHTPINEIVIYGQKILTQLNAYYECLHNPLFHPVEEKNIREVEQLLLNESGTLGKGIETKIAELIQSEVDDSNPNRKNANPGASVAMVLILSIAVCVFPIFLFLSIFISQRTALPILKNSSDINRCVARQGNCRRLSELSAVQRRKLRCP